MQTVDQLSKYGVSLLLFFYIIIKNVKINVT